MQKDSLDKLVQIRRFNISFTPARERYQLKLIFSHIVFFNVYIRYICFIYILKRYILKTNKSQER